MSFDKTRFTIFTDRLFLALIIVSLGYFFVDSISIAITQPFSFDGAIIAQVAKELVKNPNYATTYNGINRFDPSIQTGLPVILPVAIFFKLFGMSFESGLLVNTIYINLLLLAIVFYLKYCLKLSNPFVFLAILFFYSIPDLFVFGYGLYGEIPTLFYLLLAIITLHFYEINSKKIKFIFFAGLCIGLGYLTKTVILIALPAFLFVALFNYLFINRGNLLCFLKKYAFFVLGFFLPVLLFEIFKLTSLGSRRYLTWWKDQIGAIFIQAGVKSGFSDTNGLFDKFLVHFDLLSSYLRINKFMLGIMLLILFISFLSIVGVAIKNLFIAKRGNIHPKLIIPNSAFLLLIVTLSYFGWWLLITTSEKAWYRRIFNGAILLDICLVILLWFVYQFGKRILERSDKLHFQLILLRSSFFLFVLIISTAVYTFIQTKNGIITFKDSVDKLAALNAGHFLNTLPADAEIYGYGWWQAPVISFTSGRNIMDITRDTEIYQSVELKNIYLAIDSFEYTTPNLYDPVFNEFKHELLFFDHNIYIYKLEKR